jgi:autotransporter translocation and assembly factor TamB
MSLRELPPDPGAVPAAPRRRWPRRIRRALFVAAVLVAIVTVGLLGVSQTAWFRDWLRRDLIARAERLLDARVAIGRVEGDLLSGIVLDDIRLEQQGAPVIAIDRVRVTYRVLTLRRSRIVLDSVELLRPVVIARQTPQGWSLAHLVKPRVKPTGATPVTFAIDALRVYDGRVAVDPLAPGRPRRIEDLDAALAISTGPGGARVEIGALSMTLADRALRIGRFAGTIEKHEALVSVTNARLDLPRSHLNVNGNVRGVPNAPELELKVTSGAFAFDEMSRLIPGVPNRPVQAAFEAEARGPLANLTTQIDFRSPAGDARGAVTIAREAGDPPQPYGFGGTLDVRRADPGLWAAAPAVAGRVTGRAVFHVALASAARNLPVRGTFDLTNADARVAGYEARGLAARGRFDGPRVTLARARGQAYGGTFDGRGTIGPRAAGQKGVRFDLSGRIADIDVRRLPPPVPKLALETDIAGEFRARLDGPAFDAEITFDDSTVEGGRVGAGSVGTFAIAPGEIRYGGKARIEALDLGRLGTALDLAALRDVRVAGPITGDVDVQMHGRTIKELGLTAHATIDRATVAGGVATATTLDARIADRRLDVDLDGDIANLDPAVAAGVEAIQGDVNGHVRGHVSIADLDAPIDLEAIGFDGDVALGGSTVAARAITSARGSIALADGVLTLRSLEGETPLGAVTAQGALAFGETGTSDLAYAVRGIPLEQFKEQIGEVTGTVDVEGRLHGPRATLATDGTARFADVQWGETIAGVEGSSTFAIQLPDWELGRIEARPTLTAGVAGDITLDAAEATLTYADRQATFDVRAESGDRRVHVAGAADLSSPDRKRIALQQAGLSIGEQTWVLDGSRQPVVDLGPDDVRFTAIHFDDGTGQILDASGTLALRAPAVSQLNVSVRGLDMLPLEQLAGVEDPEFAGLLNAVARITGPPATPEVLGSFAIERGRYRELTFERVAGAVHYGGGRIGMDVVVEQAPGITLAVNGSVPLDLFTTSETGEGRTAAAGNGTAPIDLRVESSAIGLAILTGLTTAITEVQGTANVKLHVTGTADSPLFDGGVTVDGGAFFVPATGARYHGLTTAVRFEPGSLHVDSLQLFDEENDPLNVSGVLGLRRLAFGDVQMRAQAQRFGVIRNDLARLELDLQLEMTGQINRPSIAGNATIESGRIEVDRVLAALDENNVPLSPDDGIPIVGLGQRPAPPPAPAAPLPVQAAPRQQGAGLRRAEAGAAPGQPVAETAPGEAGAQGQRRRFPRAAGAAGRAPGTLFSRTELDVRVRIPDNLLLRGQNIRTSAAAANIGNISLVVGGDFRVQKERRRPTTLVGTVTTVRGSYEFYGRRFDILRDGRIQFQGTTPIDPALDVTGQRVIQPSGVEARIRVQGTARNPSLTFSSTPPLDESDVIALIVFNRDLNSLGASDRGTVAAMAGTAAAGMVVSPITDQLGRALGLEEIDVQTTNDASGAGGIVTIGDQLGDRTFVRLRQQFGSQEVTELQLEYRLSQLLRLQGSVADGDGVGAANRSLTRRIERAGLDLIFYYRY